MALFMYLDKHGRCGIVETDDVVTATETICDVLSTEYMLAEIHCDYSGIYQLPPYEWKWVVRHNASDAEYSLCKLKDPFNPPWCFQDFDEGSEET